MVMTVQKDEQNEGIWILEDTCLAAKVAPIGAGGH